MKRRNRAVGLVAAVLDSMVPGLGSGAQERMRISGKRVISGPPDPGWQRYHKATQEYVRNLRRSLNAWTNANRSINASDEVRVHKATVQLADALHDVAVSNLPSAVRLGKGGRPLDPADDIHLAEGIQSNHDYLVGAFIPYVLGDLTDPEERDRWETVGGIAIDRQDAWSSRLSLYDGVFWSLIWMGFGSVAASQPVRRHLTAGAAHCASCPEKAGVYDTFLDMLALTGGVPGDGSDDCRSNCRCWLETLGDGGWTSQP